MGAYIIKVTNGAFVGTIENQVDIGFSYSDKLNEINECNIKISGLGSVKRGLLSMGASVEVYRNGTLEFLGLIDSIDTLDAGGESVHVSGKEIRLVQEKGAYAGSPWSSTASATIATAVIGESSYFSAGTVEAGVNVDFRLDKAQSLWNALGNLSTKTGQDVQIDYVNDEVDILDHRGSSSSVATLNDGIHIKNIRVSTSYPKGNDVKVYGKGDGVNQIESDNAQGQDAGSKSTYGTIKEIIIDRSIISVDEANKRANIEVAKIKDPLKVYDFDVLNPDAVIATGDVVTLNSQDKDLSNESVRVVGIERGVRGGMEYLNLQVTNSAYSKLLKTSNMLLGKLQKDSVDSNSYMQGGPNFNTWGSAINAKASFPLKVGFYIPALLQDELGVLNINALTVDYDIDPYNTQFGTASFDGGDPQVQNTSGNTQPDVSGTSSNQTPTSTAGVSVWHAIQQVNLRAAGYVEENIVGSPTLFTTRGITLVTNETGGSVTVDLEFEFPSGTVSNEGNQSLGNNTTRRYNVGESSGSNSSGWFYAEDDNGVASRWTGTLENIYVHTHGVHSHADGSYTSDNHGHPDGSYDVNAADIDDISIGDDVSDAASVNATEVDIYLDYYENKAITNNETAGASVVVEMADTGRIAVGDVVYFDGSVSGNPEWIAVTAVDEDVSITVSIVSNKSAGDVVTWVNKHSVLNTGKTLDTDVDVSDSGTYPDAIGYWRVRIEPDSASSDFVNGIVKLKSAMDS